MSKNDSGKMVFAGVDPSDYPGAANIAPLKNSEKRIFENGVRSILQYAEQRVRRWRVLLSDDEVAKFTNTIRVTEPAYLLWLVRQILAGLGKKPKGMSSGEFFEGGLSWFLKLGIGGTNAPEVLVKLREEALADLCSKQKDERPGLQYLIEEVLSTEELKIVTANNVGELFDLYDKSVQRRNT